MDNASNGSRASEGRQLRDRFPALKLLQLGPILRQVPHVQPLALSDCGPACLASVLEYHGKHVRLRDISDACGGGQGGTSALKIIEVGRRFGLRGRAVSLELEALTYVGPGTILFWGFNHFVVFERLVGGGACIVDPNAGRRRVSLQECRQMFTGVAILFEREEGFTRGKGNRSRAWAYLRRILSHTGLLSRVLSASAMLQLFGLGLPFLTGAVVDRVVPLADIGLLQTLAAACAVAAGCYFATNLVRSHLVLHLRTQLDVQMTLEFLEHLSRLPYAFFQRRSAGDLMMRLNSNTTVREILTSTALSGALDGLLVVSYLVVLLFANATLGILVLAIGMLRIGVFVLTRSRFRALMSENLAKQAAAQSYQVQLFAGMETLKASGSEARAVGKWSRLFVEHLNVVVRQARLSALTQAAYDCLTYLAPLVILGAGAVLVLGGRLTLGTMLSLSALGVGFLAPLAGLVTAAGRLQELSSYVDRLDDVLEVSPEQHAGTMLRPSPLKGNVKLVGVTFRHDPGLPAAVEDVDLEVKAGQRIGIVGRSGAGKSTLAKLLMGLYSPEAGRVLYDGVDMTTLGLQNVRSQLGVVMQQPYLFGGSVRENIALVSPEASHEEIVWAAKLAQIHEVIMGMPMQYDAVVSAGGLSLSGGERQRLALARALVNKPVILVLDEATSEIDLESERGVQNALESLKCTQIVVAHRLSTIRSADQIVVMDKGRIVERGSHDELTARGGTYAQLLATQGADEPRVMGAGSLTVARR